MILALVAGASASPCCTSVGAQPMTLASCDAVGVAFGLGGDVETGGWSWDGSWSGVGDDGGGDGVASVAILGRLAPWAQAGLRVPLNLAAERLDGVTTTELGVGNALVWAGVETPGEHSVRGAFEAGFGTEGPSGTSPGAGVVQLVGRGEADVGPWRGWTAVVGRIPVLGVGIPDGEASIVVDRAVATHARVGLGLGATAAAGSAPEAALLVGPSFTLSPSIDDRVLVSLRAGIAGRNTPSRVALTFDWYRVLAHTREAG